MPSIRISALFNILEDSQIYVFKYLTTIRFWNQKKKQAVAWKNCFSKYLNSSFRKFPELLSVLLIDATTGEFVVHS
jgi:hypothetical protein